MTKTTDSTYRIPNTPPKGTADWFPEEFAIRKYIFDTWREVCTSYGYQEYLTPMLESADLYRAKSGEDLGGKELTTLTDRGGRELAIRPEMTPSVTRMISRVYESTPKPIRYFSIANFFRNEKPQRGRNREFWQLNFDIFGSENTYADIEILQIALEIMERFGAPEGSFNMHVNNRKLIDAVLDGELKISPEIRQEVVRTMDKFGKMSEEIFVQTLIERGLDSAQAEDLVKFMNSDTPESLLANFPQLESNPGYLETLKIIKALGAAGYAHRVRFQPNVIRGFDYYDGMVFEVFDNHPDNNRAMFGGGRYNGLASIFGAGSFPAVGCAPGDESTRLFLQSWDLLGKIAQRPSPRRIYLPMIDADMEEDIQQIARKLRAAGDIVEVGFEVENLRKATTSAQKRGFTAIAIYGQQEKGGVEQIKLLG